ncbi:hypothetical protein DFH06DRAFT_1346285 [Mycena polygramma]|nr:hypothetical protein DFH06DRAFT_1346285 [Mycena polygramma]
MSSDSAPFLPPELERVIIESAAELHPECISNLFLVSHRVHDWTERVRYRTVTHSGGFSTYSVGALLRAIRSNTKPASFFHDRVQHLFLERIRDSEEIVSVCSGIRSFALTTKAMQLNSGLGAIRPRRLNLLLEFLLTTINSPDQPHPMFTNVTHLDVLAHSLNPDLISHLALLPVLTHLSIWHNSAPLRDVLARCPKLRALIDMDDSFVGPDDLAPIDDARVVYMAVSDAKYEEDWVIGTLGGLDFWARADAFIAKKRRGEIKPSAF